MCRLKNKFYIVFITLSDISFHSGIPTYYKAKNIIRQN